MCFIQRMPILTVAFLVAQSCQAWTHSGQAVLAPQSSALHGYKEPEKKTKVPPQFAALTDEQPHLTQPKSTNIKENKTTAATEVRSILPHLRRNQRKKPSGSVSAQLKELEALAHRGLISLDEYRERQKLILQGK